MKEKEWINVAAAIIIREEDGKYFITQRLPHEHNALKWEFNGGKFKESEDPKVCLKRELKEEVGIKINVNELYCVVEHIYDEGTGKEKRIRLHAYLCDYISGEPQKIGIYNFAWVTIEEMKDYDFSEADLEIVSKLRQDFLKK